MRGSFGTRYYGVTKALPDRYDSDGEPSLLSFVERRLAIVAWNTKSMNTPPRSEGIGETFEDVIVPHIDAAYRLARWLTGNEADAQDLVQEASLRAFRYFRTFDGRNARAWFLRIVRNVCWSRWQHAPTPATDVFDEEQHSGGQQRPDPETLLLQTDDAWIIDSALRNLPKRSRELLVLREMEGLSYQELADVLDIPIGTVMSGLSRARGALRTALERQFERLGMSDARRPSQHEPVGCGARGVPDAARGDY
jgi:RNA polymerase sigma-70 factor, ECF subfamily